MANLYKCIAKTMRKHTKLKSYRFTESMVNQLDELQKYSIVESKFVRLAIEEKLKRDLPKLKEKKEEVYCPF